jgi:hypothetical protein
MTKTQEPAQRIGNICRKRTPSGKGDILSISPQETPGDRLTEIDLDEKEFEALAEAA